MSRTDPEPKFRSNFKVKRQFTGSCAENEAESNHWMK